MLSVVFLVGVVIAAVQGNCPPCPPNPVHLDELNCVGSPDQQGDCCPVKFTCPKIELSPSSCWFKGKAYAIGEEIQESEIGVCRGGCICREGGDGNPGRFNCPILDCAEVFQAQPAADCIRQYSLDSCCSSGTVCGAERDSLGKCEFRGENVLRGQRLYPKTHACHFCVCNEHFEDHVNPDMQPKSCSKLNCGIHDNLEEVQKFCAPVYYGTEQCCPHSWECPKADTEVKIIKNNSSRTHLSCKFGETTVPFGDVVDVGNKCKVCTCDKPPFVICKQDPKCSE